MKRLFILVTAIVSSLGMRVYASHVKNDTDVEKMKSRSLILAKQNEADIKYLSRPFTSHSAHLSHASHASHYSAIADSTVSANGVLAVNTAIRGLNYKKEILTILNVGSMSACFLVKLIEFDKKKLEDKVCLCFIVLDKEKIKYFVPIDADDVVYVVNMTNKTCSIIKKDEKFKKILELYKEEIQ